MIDEKKKRKPLGLQLSSMPTASKEQIRQNLSHGRSKTVIVEVKRKRGTHTEEKASPERSSKLTDQEQSLRWRALHEALLVQEEEKVTPPPCVKDESFEEQLITERVEEALPLSLPPEEDKPSRFEERKKRAAQGSFTDLEEGLESKKVLKSARKKSGKPQVNQEGQGEVEDILKPVMGLKKLRRRGARNIQMSAPRKVIMIKEGMSLSYLSDQFGQKSSVFIKNLSKIGITVTDQTNIDEETACLIAQEYGHPVIRSNQEDKESSLWNQEPLHLKERPPVVTIMGHVDHGKTSLLDALRKTDVAGQEAGGITQHIGAYQVRLSSGKIITFIDTPGHQAFTQMRARGSHITDIIVLVVAADEGVSEQTVEAIRHCQLAKVPMIVAINKIDKPGARPDHVRQALLSYDIVVEKLGGDVQDVEISALKGLYLKELEEAILLQAEILGLQGDETLQARGVILETHVKKGHGSLASVLIQQGSLRRGDVFVVGNTWGRVRLLFDDKGKVVKSAIPSQPVEVVGFHDLPLSGDRMIVVDNEAQAKEFVEWKKEKVSSQENKEVVSFSLADSLKEKSMTEQRIILKADAQGSLEGVSYELSHLRHEEIGLKIIHQAVGPINESDALLAQTTGALLVSFNVAVLPEARKIIEKKNTPLLHHTIIYHLIEEMKKILTGLLTPLFHEEMLGKAQVIQVFHIKKVATIAGCLIKEGILRRGESIRVVRQGKEVFKGLLRSLRHQKDDVKEKSSGQECGVLIDGFTAFHIGDVIECFIEKEIKRSF